MEKAVDSNPSSSTKNLQLRFERKFVYPAANTTDIIESEVLNNPFLFQEIYTRRTVNNIYFDDVAMSFYHQNVSGVDIRDKYRLRWYSDNYNTIENPVFEIKKKYGLVGDKLSFKLTGFKWDLKKHSLDETMTAILDAVKEKTTQELHLNLSTLSPSLYNSYERRYFLSNCEDFRITIDYHMNFYNPQFKNYELSKVGLEDVVLELKYKRNKDKESRGLTQHLQSRLSKNSKYVRGIDLINNLVHG
ncbi:MAG: VTC domain-containing protein [Bacteroidetes bacterium]|nr:VTC domain-containing protein [Bacteroidota bacterium]